MINPDMNNQIALALIEQRKRAAMQQQPQQAGPLGSPFAPRPMLPRAPVMGTPQPQPPQPQAPNAFQNSYNAVTNALAPEAEPYKGTGLKALFAKLFGNKDSEGGAAP